MVRLPEVPPKLETLEDAKQLLLQNYGYAHSLKASGKIAVRRSREKTWRPASIVLMVQKPDKVRMRGYRPLTPTLFELISNGRECWLFVPPENTAYLDEHCNVLQRGDAGIAISADAIVASLMVVSDTDKLFALPASVNRDNKNLRVMFGEGAGIRKEIWIDLETGLVTRQLLIDPDGRIQADIAYREVTVLENAAIPIEISLKLPRLRTSIRVRVSDFQFNPTIPAAAFNFSPPKSVQILAPTPEKLESFFSGER
jgi:outer membrane lipoprotein-sorting protein